MIFWPIERFYFPSNLKPQDIIETFLDHVEPLNAYGRDNVKKSFEGTFGSNCIILKKIVPYRKEPFPQAKIDFLPTSNGSEVVVTISFNAIVTIITIICMAITAYMPFVLIADLIFKIFDPLLILSCIIPFVFYILSIIQYNMEDKGLKAFVFEKLQVDLK